MIKEAIVKIVDKQDLTYDEAYTVMNEIMRGETTPTQNAAFLAALSTKSTKAETIDEIVGCAACQKAADEADLLRVAVSGSRRKEGIAGALLETLFAEALLTGVRTVFLEVRASNRPAVALYLKHGFTHVSLRKNYYGNEDAVVMKKEFCESD